jgi:hypothetical protein
LILCHWRPPGCSSHSPFWPPPSSCNGEDGGSTQGLCSFLERRPRLRPGSRDGFPPQLHFPPTSYPARVALQHSLLGQERSLHKQGGGGPPFHGGHRRGCPLSSSLLHQHHLPHPQEKWRHEADPQLEKVECGSPGHPILMHGDCRGRAPRPQTRRLGGVHQFEGTRIFISFCTPPPGNTCVLGGRADSSSSVFSPTDFHQPRRSSHPSPDSSRCISGQGTEGGGPQPSSPCFLSQGVRRGGSLIIH